MMSAKLENLLLVLKLKQFPFAFCISILLTL